MIAWIAKTITGSVVATGEIGKSNPECVGLAAASESEAVVHKHLTTEHGIPASDIVMSNCAFDPDSGHHVCTVVVSGRAEKPA